MKFLTSIVAIIAMAASAEACQCLSADGVNEAATKDCCGEAGGSPDGNQCPADDIGENLSKFAQCCRDYGTRSDCRCPVGCARTELEAMAKKGGTAPPTDDEVEAYVASYED